MRKYVYEEETNIRDLMKRLNDTSKEQKIHVINIFSDGVNYIAIYEVDENE